MYFVSARTSLQDNGHAAERGEASVSVRQYSFEYIYIMNISAQKIIMSENTVGYIPSLSSPPLLLLKNPISSFLPWFPLHVLEPASAFRRKCGWLIYLKYTSSSILNYASGAKCFTHTASLWTSVCKREEKLSDRVLNQTGQQPFWFSFGLSASSEQVRLNLHLSWPRPAHYPNGKY